MSFRELRNFTEILRALGFNRNISLENFHEPNFQLVAEILFWFAVRYDPNADITDSIDEENDRVLFLKQICQLFSSKARIQMNAKSLYEAQGNAVKEMLKVAKMMYKAQKSNEAYDYFDDNTTQMIDVSTSSKLHNLKKARLLANEIAESGSKLFDMLGDEMQLRHERSKALEFLDSFSSNLDRNSEQQHIEKCIRNIFDTQSVKMNEMSAATDQMRQEEGELENKIGRRRKELDRFEKRFKGLADVKPEYQQEYEHLEGEVEHLHNLYASKFVNLDFIDDELEQYVLKDQVRREKTEIVIMQLRNQDRQQQKDEIYNDTEYGQEFGDQNNINFVDDQMRSNNLNAFGAKKDDTGERNLQQWQGVSSDEEEEEEEEEGEQALEVSNTSDQHDF